MELTKDNPWDEDTIMALYRAYQQTRDGVDYRHYRSILQAARENAGSVRAEKAMEKSMDVIRLEAARLYPGGEKSDVDKEVVSDRNAVKRNVSPGAMTRWFESRMSQVSNFLESISPAKLMPVAVTIAVLAAVTPFILDTGTQTDSFMSEQVALLNSHRGHAADELGRLGEFRHGFSAFNHSGSVAGENRYAEAFSSGVILIDIQTIDPDDNEAQLLKMIESVSAAPLLKEKLGDQSLSLVERVVNANAALQKHYADDRYKPAFLFGQWVESAYLLSRVALINNDVGVMTSALDNLPQMSGLLENAGYLSERLQKDLGRLEAMRSNQTFSRDEVSTASSILLKLRTLEPQVRGV